MIEVNAQSVKSVSVPNDDGAALDMPAVKDLKRMIEEEILSSVSLSVSVVTPTES